MLFSIDLAGLRPLELCASFLIETLDRPVEVKVFGELAQLDRKHVREVVFGVNPHLLVVDGQEIPIENVLGIGGSDVGVTFRGHVWHPLCVFCRRCGVNSEGRGVGRRIHRPSP